MRVMSLVRRVVLAAVVVGLLVSSSPSPADAQVPVGAPGPGWVAQDGGWLPPGHPAIRVPAPVPPPPTAPVVAPLVPGMALPTLTGCDHVNPYTGLTSSDCVIGTYRVGRVYWFTDVERALVIGVTQDARGVEVVTVQFLDALGGHRGGPDHLLTFRNDGTFRPWVWLAEHAPHLVGRVDALLGGQR